MNILYHHRTAATDAQRVHIVEMIRAFRALGHTVRVAALVDPEAPEPGPGDRAKPAPWRRWTRSLPFVYDLTQLAYNLCGVPMLLTRLAAGSSDFLYERYALFNFSGVVAARLAGKPLILEVNSPLALELHREGAIRLCGLARRMETWILNHATRVIAVSGPLRDILISQGADPDRVQVMPNGVDPGHFRPDSDRGALKRRRSLGNRTIIGFLGWFRPWHGVELLIEAFHRERLEQRNAALLLVGDGPNMMALRADVKARGLDDHVVFTGAVPHAEIPHYLAMIDIAVQPAANEYCCPMKVIEYMAAARPIVAPRQPNITELVEDGHQARLFTPGDVVSLGEALRALVDHPDDRSAMGRRAAETIVSRGLLWTENARTVLEWVERGSGR